MTFRAQLAALCALHRQYVEAYERCGLVLLADGTRAMRMADCAKAAKHRQIVRLLEDQAARLVRP